MSDALPGRVASRVWSALRRLPGLGGRPVTLRERLLLSITALVVLLALAIGAVSVVALRSSLLDQLDAELAQSVSRATSPLGGGPGGYASTTPDQSDLSGPRQAPGTVTAYVLDGRVQGLLLDEDGTLQALTADQAEALTADLVPRTPQTVRLGGGLGDYRVEAVPVTFTSISAASASSAVGVLVVGLPLTSVTQTVTAMVAVIAVVSLLGLALAIALAVAVVRSALRPLERMAETASRVAELPLDRGEVALAERVDEGDADSRTEVGRVGVALNRMLGHVSGALTARQQSEAKVRQFVADASHELRTPLASIRGYSELTRRMHADLPDDVTYSMGRIESESLRMTSLVEDLLLLARLDEGRDLVTGEVDLTRVVVDAVADAHAASATHPVDVAVPDEPVTVPGDAMRLHQVVANLLANARTHTPEGTPVHVVLAVDEVAQEARVTVADEGPGIDPGVLPVLFERFARADSSRSRTAGSTGLGLAIVQAVVQAHHGTVDVASDAAGAAFTVRLPLRAPRPADAPAGAPESRVARSEGVA